jgi:predicted outer membrane protein
MDMYAEVPATQHQLQDLIQRKATKVSEKRMNSMKQETEALKTSGEGPII